MDSFDHSPTRSRRERALGRSEHSSDLSRLDLLPGGALPLIRRAFASEPPSGGGASSDDRQRNPPRGKYLAREQALATFYRDHWKKGSFGVPDLVALLPDSTFHRSEEDKRAISERLRDPALWRELSVDKKLDLPYFDINLTASGTNWYYTLRWHTPTARSLWAHPLPTITLERRWKHFIDPNSSVVRTHQVLLFDYAQAPEEHRQKLFEELGKTELADHRITGRADPHVWLNREAYRSLDRFHPTLEWIRSVRDAAHRPGHPAGLELPPDPA